MTIPSSHSPDSAGSRAEPPLRILLLPGWLDSGAMHWQSRWESAHGFERVSQSDWVWPRRGDWMARLEEVIFEQPGQVVLVAHSLGCHLAAAWAAHSAHVDRIGGALLVAPPDVEREDTPANLFNWRPMLRQGLPFRSRVVASDNDPFCSLSRTRTLAEAWGSALTVVGPCGHLNGDSGLGDWPQGLELLRGLRQPEGGTRDLTS